jgi:subtilisin-like proprotein convertase family protein
MMTRIYLTLLFLISLSSCVQQEGNLAPESASSSEPGPVENPTEEKPSVKIPIPDPFASEAWHLNNIGQKSFSKNSGFEGEDLNLIQEALSYTGKGIRIAVSDTGIEYTHEDLSSNQLKNEHRNYSFTNPSDWRNGLGAYNHPGEDHGTAVTGLICAEADNGKGSRGVAPDAKFAAFRFVLDYGVTSTDSRMIDQADGHFDIFNYSYGYAQCQFQAETEEVYKAYKIGVENLRNKKGAIYIQSAGNDYNQKLSYCIEEGDDETLYFGNTNISSTLATPYKIVVGAINADGVKSSYSTPGSSIWVSAPGGEDGVEYPGMITTDVSSCAKGYAYFSAPRNFNKGLVNGNLNCNYTSLMNGTSAAAPMVSGVVALMLEANPELTWREVKHILAETADKINFFENREVIPHPGDGSFQADIIDYDFKWVENSAEKKFSNWYGFGSVNALQAVLAAKTFTSGSLGTYEETINPYNEIWYYSSASALGKEIADYDGAEAIWTEDTIEVKHNFIIEAVQVTVTIEHGSPKDLAIKLTSPSGVESVLLNYNSQIIDTEFPTNHLMLTNAFYGEESLGEWKLSVVDATSSYEGTLENWKINIHGHKVTPSADAPAPVTGLSRNHSNTSYNSMTPLFSFTESTSDNVIRYEASVGQTPGANDIYDWSALPGISNQRFEFTKNNLERGKTYYINVRAVNDKEVTSTIETVSWNINP